MRAPDCNAGEDARVNIGQRGLNGRLCEEPKRSIHVIHHSTEHPLCPYACFAPIPHFDEGRRHATRIFFVARSEEHTSELQSLMRISYAVFCLKKKKKYIQQNKHTHIKHK